MTKKQFIEFVGENARRGMTTTGVSAPVRVAQAILETGCRKHTVGEAKNLFGIKGRGAASSVRALTQERLDGKWMPVDADFAKYNSFEESITEHARFFLRNRRYARSPTQRRSRHISPRDTQGRLHRRAGLRNQVDRTDAPTQSVPVRSLRPAFAFRQQYDQ